jgi:hypothetical protein
VDEILPGVIHWSAMHPGIRQRVSSYFVAPAGVLVDPMTPSEGLDALRRFGEPRLVVLTNRHHLRDAERFRGAFGCRILCHEAGLHEFAGRDVEVDGFAWGDEIAPGVRALEVDAICAEESALHVDAGPGAVAIADAVVRWGWDDELAFVPDFLLGDVPEAVKRGVRAAARRIAGGERFDALLPAHGAPIVGGAREALARFADAA